MPPPRTWWTKTAPSPPVLLHSGRPPRPQQRFTLREALQELFNWPDGWVWFACFPLFLSLLTPPLLLLHIFLTRCRSWARFNAATKREPGDEQAVASDENSGGDGGRGGEQQQHDAEKLDGVLASSPTAPPLQRRGRRGGEDDRGRLGQEVELAASSRSKSRKSSKGAEP